MSTKVDYGLDAPGVIVGAIAAGTALTIAAYVFPSLRAAVSLGVLLAALGIATYWSSRRGKLWVRDSVLDRLALRGDERLLDVGCGRGLFLVAAAKRLAAGKAFGLDLWSQVDQLDNHRRATFANASAEGVSERVEIVDGDMRAMPFDAESFDIVVSNLAIHNVPSDSGRKQSIAEIVRVLKPGGRVALVDLAFTSRYGAWLRDGGLVDVQREWPARWFFPPLGIVTARKPGTPP